MRMVFEAAKKAGWLEGRRLDFMGFGLVQGQDGISDSKVQRVGKTGQNNAKHSKIVVNMMQSHGETA